MSTYKDPSSAFLLKAGQQIDVHYFLLIVTYYHKIK